MNSVDRAVEKCTGLLKYHVSPFNCVYWNPHKYNITHLMKWCQKYLFCRMYMNLLKASEITGYECVPDELMLRNAARDGFSGRRIRIGRASFYLLKRDEMSKGLRNRYDLFKEQMTSFYSSNATENSRR